MSSASVTEMELNKDRFLELLAKLIGETKDHLVNLPPEQVPQECFAEQHVRKALEQYCGKDGPLTYKVVEAVKGRSNVIITYPQQDDSKNGKTVAFAGSHFDVVPIANPAEWKHDPYQLTVEGDMLYGRGTTDCLGHVALQTELFLQLAINRPRLNVAVVGVLIADEEVGADPDIGIEGLQKNGHLELLKGGPVYFLDCADKMPCIGSGGTIAWRLKAHGKAGHSGYPHKAINSMELVMEGMSYVQKRFYEEFAHSPLEKKYKFASTSSMKPTNWNQLTGGLNQIKEDCFLEGDIRTVPFHLAQDVKPKVEGFVKDFNQILANLAPKAEEKSGEEAPAKKLKTEASSSSESPAAAVVCRCAEFFPSRGPDSHFHAEDATASIEIEWLGQCCDGLAVDMESEGYAALVSATEKHVGPVHTLADTGTLPLVADLQKAGLDIQCMGYGVEDAYHMDNEFARLSDFEQGFKVITQIIQTLSDNHKN